MAGAAVYRHGASGSRATVRPTPYETIVDMQIARADAHLIVAGIEGASRRMHKLEESHSLTEHERASLNQTIEATEHALELARQLFGTSSLSR